MASSGSAAGPPPEAEPFGTVVVLSPPPAVGSAAASPTLVYWNIRGLAAPLRLALEYAGEPYTDVRIDAGDAAAPGYKQSWFAHKPALGLAFPNLPYLLDGEVAITQSHAILRHIGRKHGLCGGDAATQATVDMVVDEMADLDSSLTRLCYRTFSPEALREWEESRLRPSLAALERFLGDGPFVAGAAVTIADFKAWDEVDKARIVSPGCLDAHPRLLAYHARFRALPRIAAFLGSPGYAERPLNNPHARFR